MLLAASSRQRPSRSANRLVRPAILLGIAWGAVDQPLQTFVSSIAGWASYALWLLLLVPLLLLLARGRHPVTMGWVCALFWSAAVVSYYGYYLAQLSLGLGRQGAWLDIANLGGLRVAWNLLRASLLPYTALAAVSGFTFGCAFGIVQRWLHDFFLRRNIHDAQGPQGEF